MVAIKAVIFDIDNTLTKENSWGKIAEAMGMTISEDHDIYNLSKTGTVPPRDLDKMLLILWQRKGLAKKENFVKVFTEMELRDDAKDLVDYLKQKDIKVCLITGSMDMYAEIVAKRVGADEYYFNTPLSYDEQGNITDLIYEKDQTELKLKQFKEFCKKNNLTSEDCVVVGDSANDFLLFTETKKGVAIRTEAEDKILEPVAWKIINRLSEIKDIL